VIVPDINPAHPSRSVADVHLASSAAAAEAVEAAHRAFPGWRKTAPPARGAILRRAADILEQRAPTVAREFVAEEGKTLPEAFGEIQRTVATFRYYAGQTLEADGQTFASHSSSTFLYARREPIGVVVAITPWNFPFAIPAWKLAPALAFGNTVVWKPAEITSVCSVRLIEALIDAGLPGGVANLVIGRGTEVGDALVQHEKVSAVSFTGSNSVGLAVQQKAIAKGMKVQLELGGKNPAVILADANLSLAAEQVAKGAFMSAGQKCTATSRVIVDHSVLSDFAARLASLASTWKVGDPLDEDTRVGPVVSEAQLQSVCEFLKDDGTGDMQFLAGGGRDETQGEGYYVNPTVILGAGLNSRLLREEIFGPVAVLIPADGFDEAVRLANDTPFGLSASLFTRDLNSALRFTQEIQAGIVKVNQESAGVEVHVPFGGYKASSSGIREQGKAAQEFFTQWKTVYVDPG
jgi:alpha-ketoglutaric semialdehyde dehydrogenase